MPSPPADDAPVLLLLQVPDENRSWVQAANTADITILTGVGYVTGAVDKPLGTLTNDLTYINDLVPGSKISITDFN